MATIYNVNDSLKGVNGFGSKFSDITFSADIAAATDTSLAVPDIIPMGAASATAEPTYLAVFTYETGVDVYVAVNVAAAIPAGAAFAATASVLRPSAKVVKSGDVLHFFSTPGAQVTVEFYFTQAN